MLEEQKVACLECGLVHHYRPIAPGLTATCQRCTAVLYRNRPYMFDIALAMTLTGLVLFVLSNVFPLLGLRAQGVVQELNLWQASFVFWEQEYYLLAILLFFNLIIFPLFELLALLWVLLTIRWQWQPAFALWLYRWAAHLKPWGMLEVFMLGMLVAVVKLGDLATLILGTAFWSFLFLVVSMAIASTTLDPFSVWNRLKTCNNNDYAVSK